MNRLFTLFIFVTSLFQSLIISAQGQGQYYYLSTEVNGLTRQYRLYVPPDHDATKPWPVVFLFHGFGVSIEWQISISQMCLVADTAKFFVVYPQGRQIQDINYNLTNTGWLVPGYEPVGTAYSDLDFVSKIIEDLDNKPEYAIDQSRVYSTGWSNGSEMAFYTGCALSDKIAAVAGVASQLSNVAMAACLPPRKISTLYIQGTADIYVPSNGDAYYPPISTLPAFWAENSNCSTPPTSTDLPNTVTTDNSTVTLLTYPDCDDGHEVFFYRVVGGGHNWPGGWLPAGFPNLHPINRDIHASVEIWNFFNRHPHPDIASSAKEIESIDFVRLYPNPAEDILTIQLSDGMPHSERLDITLFDLAGKACLNTVIYGQSNLTIDVSSLRPGMYLLEAKNNTRSYFQKLIVQ